MSNVCITKGIINRVVVTVGERSQLIDPYYLIKFTSKFSTEETTTVTSVVDIAPNNIRYNLIEISEKTNPNPLNGEVYLISGEWSYEIYESQNQTIDVNATTGRVLQRGLIIVKE